MAKRTVAHHFRKAHHLPHSDATSSTAPTSQAKRIILITISVIVTAALLIALTWVVSYHIRVQRLLRSQQALAQTYDFDPGNIISDTQFFNGKAMSESQIQHFLTEHGSALATTQFDGEHISGNGVCTDFKAEGKVSAAHVIAQAAVTCSISPKVLLTMLQKEQHLISEQHPSAFALKAAMGLSCPDTADCDPQYAGFVKQVVGAAQRYQYYTQHINEYQYRERKISSIRYSPQATCGTGDVYIENRATALLYIYTPYQPNIASLQAGGGEGDSCSSYGNRNFALIYSGWFGNPREE